MFQHFTPVFYNTEYALFLLLLGLGLFCFIGIIYFVILGVQNERIAIKFRKAIKIGDLTDQGPVIKIVDDTIFIEKSIPLHLVYPPDLKKSI